MSQGDLEGRVNASETTADEISQRLRASGIRDVRNDADLIQRLIDDTDR